MALSLSLNWNASTQKKKKTEMLLLSHFYVKKGKLFPKIFVLIDKNTNEHQLGIFYRCVFPGFSLKRININRKRKKEIILHCLVL